MTKQLLLRQHSRLLSLVAEIEFLLLSRASEAMLAEKINDYIEVVRAHFDVEERHLLACHPAQFIEHVKIHKAYQRRLFKTCSEPAKAHSNFDLELLTHWWEKHIQEVDSLYLEDRAGPGNSD